MSSVLNLARLALAKGNTALARQILARAHGPAGALALKAAAIPPFQPTADVLALDFVAGKYREGPGNSYGTSFTALAGVSYTGGSIPATGLSCFSTDPHASISGINLPTTGYCFAEIASPASIPTDNARVVGGFDGVNCPLFIGADQASIGAYNSSVGLMKAITFPSAGTPVRMVATWTTGSRKITALGLTPASDTGAIGALSSGVRLGFQDAIEGFIKTNLRKVFIGSTLLSDAAMQAMTA